MASPQLLQGSYEMGMRQDEPRAFLPRGAVWNLVDFIPELGAPLRKRGGWAYGSGDLTSTLSGSTYVAMVAHAPFVSGTVIAAISNNSKLAKITSADYLSAELVGTVVTPVSRPVMHNGLLIIPDGTAAAGPKFYDGGSVGNLAGTPPAAKYAVVSKDRTWLAGTTAKPTYVYFSQASDPTATWDTTNSWISVSEPITGMAALPNAVLVFQQDRAARVRGSIPPAQAGALGSSDFQVDDPIFNQGCIDARSIATFAGYAVFANAAGIFLTNGSNLPEDLTKSCGISRYWQTLMGAYASSTWTVAGGIYQGEYWVSVMDGTTLKDCLVLDLNDRRVRRVDNVKAISFAQTGAVTGDELLFSSRVAGRLGRLSTTFAPAISYKNDADGAAVLPILETPFYRGKPGMKRWRAAYLDYDLRDAASDNPTLRVAYIATPDGVYSTIGDVSETAAKSRSRVALRFLAEGVAFRVTQTQASEDTRVYEFAADAHPVEGSRLPRGGDAVGAGASGTVLVRS